MLHGRDHEGEQEHGKHHVDVIIGVPFRDPLGRPGLRRLSLGLGLDFGRHGGGCLVHGRAGVCELLPELVEMLQVVSSE